MTPFNIISGKKINLKLIIQMVSFVFSTGKTGGQSSISGATSWFHYLIASVAKFSIKGLESNVQKQSLSRLWFGGKSNRKDGLGSRVRSGVPTTSVLH